VLHSSGRSSPRRRRIRIQSRSARWARGLADSLLEIGPNGDDLVTLEELALPFATRIAEHLRQNGKQGTSGRSRFLDACRAYNRNEIDAGQLRDATVRLGFKNVIDAFHVVDGDDVDERFFLDERDVSRAIRLTDNLRTMLSDTEGADLRSEIQARWRLVEIAWELNMSRGLLTVEFEPTDPSLVVPRRGTNIASARNALNGYQKGHCFYCYTPISITGQTPDVGEVDHVFAWSVGDYVAGAPVDGVWNLVLACARCNSWHEKSDRPPVLPYVQRLHRSNEFLISSHHPPAPHPHCTNRTNRTRPCPNPRAHRSARNHQLPGGLWGYLESNQGPHPYQGCALTD
jgi:hypothetical protein